MVPATYNTSYYITSEIRAYHAPLGTPPFAGSLSLVSGSAADGNSGAVNIASGMAEMGQAGEISIRVGQSRSSNSRLLLANRKASLVFGESISDAKKETTSALDFKIQVATRFKPPSSSGSINRRGMSLPLHQRMQLLRAGKLDPEDLFAAPFYTSHLTIASPSVRRDMYHFPSANSPAGRDMQSSARHSLPVYASL